jgi:hypothetical protein
MWTAGLRTITMDANQHSRTTLAWPSGSRLKSACYFLLELVGKLDVAFAIGCPVQGAERGAPTAFAEDNAYRYLRTDNDPPRGSPIRANFFGKLLGRFRPG